jgi:two-component system, chemotaxis family, CheB/CheR fusion protein
MAQTKPARKISRSQKKQEPARSGKPTPEEFPMVAIGASAGGLEAITELLKNLPSRTGMAYIYVQHLSPDYKSILPELLAQQTAMPVLQAKDRDKIRPDHFYVIPPNKEMRVLDGHIKLIPRKKSRASNLAIDVFFSSLAEKHGEKVIGVLLSGSGIDGTHGMKVIKEEGGVTFVQDASAKFDSMPKSAIAEGVVDFVLSPKEIAKKLTALARKNDSKPVAVASSKISEIDNSNPDLKMILQVLFKRTGVDFSYYKMNTIKRRIARRMPVHNIRTLGQYAKLLLGDTKETDLLYEDLLIHVTDFFRENGTFQYLKSTLVPRLLKKKAQGETFRIWVPGCSTGEEAYSLAMLMLELQDARGEHVPFQVFATDLSERAVNLARNGEYTLRELQSVSTKRLQRFFIKSKDKFRAKRCASSVYLRGTTSCAIRLFQGWTSSVAATC